jgi:hypothetical protein
VLGGQYRLFTDQAASCVGAAKVEAEKCHG